MGLSRLQKYILTTCYFKRGKKCLCRELVKFYSQKKKPKKENIPRIITKSIVRLIRNELAIGYGKFLPHKSFIEQIKLTPKGRKKTKKLLGQQQKLPFDILKI